MHQIDGFEANIEKIKQAGVTSNNGYKIAAELPTW
jgi:hypothetical protein